MGLICTARATAGTLPLRRATVVGSSFVRNQKANAITTSVAAQIRRTPGQSKAIIVIGARTCVIEVRSEEHTSELQSLMRISYAVFCLQQKTHNLNYR